MDFDTPTTANRTPAFDIPMVDNGANQGKQGELVGRYSLIHELQKIIPHKERVGLQITVIFVSYPGDERKSVSTSLQGKRYELPKDKPVTIPLDLLGNIEHATYRQLVTDFETDQKTGARRKVSRVVTICEYPWQLQADKHYKKLDQVLSKLGYVIDAGRIKELKKKTKGE